MTSTDDLVSVLKKLRLSGVLLTLPLRIRQAVEENLDHQEFLYRLLHDETERRDGKQLDLRLGRANFEHQKTMEDFDFHFNPGVPRSQVIELATCGFVGRHEVVLLLGATGVGKSHLAQALGHRAVRHGHTVLYTGANALFAQLRAARGDGSFDRRMLKYTSPDLLITDINMPNMNGFELLEAIKEDEKLKSTPVLMITAEASKDDVLKAAKFGASAYIVKPFSKAILEDKIHKLFKRKAH